MNDKTLALARSFKLAASLVLHGKVSDNSAWIAARDAAELTILARKLDRYNEQRCSVPVTERQDRAANNARLSVSEILATYGALPHFGGDPRGPAVRYYWREELPADCTDPDTYSDRMSSIEV